MDAIEWARRGVDQGVGEILLNSMDADGTTGGFDLELIAAVRAVVDVPLIASGGAGRVEDFPPAVDAGADAVLAASVFHFGTLRIADVKAALSAAGHPVRGPVGAAASLTEEGTVTVSEPSSGCRTPIATRPTGGWAGCPDGHRGRLLPRRRRRLARRRSPTSSSTCCLHEAAPRWLLRARRRCRSCGSSRR